MIATHKEYAEKTDNIGMSVISIKGNNTNTIPFQLVKNSNGSRRRRSVATAMAKKRRDGSTQTSSSKQKPNFSPKNSTKLIAQSTIAVLGLGFIDAGYSGDWSRIGVITKESEELLKVAAFFVVPICLFFIVYLSNRSDSEELNS